MVIVLFSRALMVPVYMAQLGLIGNLRTHLKDFKQYQLCHNDIRTCVGAFIVLRSMWVGRREERQLAAEPVKIMA